MSKDKTRFRVARIHPAAVATIAILCGVVGCYTILQHPITENEGPERVEGDAHSQEYYRQNCLDCHADYATYPYGYFYGFYPEYYFENPRWGYYYAYPWWWDRGWYSQDAAVGPDSLGAVGATKAERRGGMAPPYVDRAPAVSVPSTGVGGYRAPSSEAASGKGGTGTGPGGAGPGTTPTKTRVKMGSQAPADSTATDDQKTKDKKAERRGGTTPPK
jgi:hypothetical protein